MNSISMSESKLKTMSKKRPIPMSFDVYFGAKKRKTTDKKQTNSEVISHDSDDDDDDSFPIKLPGLFKHDDEYVYINNNHLFFHTNVSEKSVDQVKKLMREYMIKCNKVKKQHSCGTFIPKPLVLHIYSPGGDVYAGFSLYDFIIGYNQSIPVYTLVEGFAASAATIISVAGSKRFITPTAYMLIHQLSTFFGGSFEQIKEEFGNCEKLMDKIKKIYSDKTKVPKKQLSDILKHDIIWDSTECLKYGLVDEIKLIDIFNDDNI